MTSKDNTLDEKIDEVIELAFRAGFLSGSGLSFIEDKGRSYKKAHKTLYKLITDEVLGALGEVKNILTGSEDFRVEPGVKLNLSIGQIHTLRSAITKIEERWKR